MSKNLVPGLDHVDYWFWGRPTPYQLWEDVQGLLRRIKPDFDPTVPEQRRIWSTDHA